MAQRRTSSRADVLLARPVRRIALQVAVALVAFIALALWNGFVAVLWAVAATTWILASLYARTGGLGD
jgi:hypothetical protein